MYFQVLIRHAYNAIVFAGKAFERMVPIDEDKDLAFHTGYDYDTSALNEIDGNPTPPLHVKNRCHMVSV